MNKPIIKWFSMFLLLMVGTMSAVAQTIALADFSIKAGETKDVAITVSEAVYGIQTDVTLSEGLTLVSASSAQDDLSFNMNEANGRIALLSLAGNKIAAGDAITLKVKAADTFETGTISLKNTYITTDNLGTEVKPADVTATVTLDQTPEPTPEYYIVGSMTDWAVNADYKMTLNSEAQSEEYTFTADMTAGSEFKVIKVLGETQTWYPDGMGNNYSITNAGNYTIYFRPNYDGGDDWFYNCIFVASNDEPIAEATWTLAGSAKSLFGESWWFEEEGSSVNNLEKGDGHVWTKTYTNKLLTGVVYYGVFKNHGTDEYYPAGLNPEDLEGTAQQLTVDGIGYYDVTFTFNDETHALSAQATKKGDYTITSVVVNGNSSELFNGDLVLAETSAGVWTGTIEAKQLSAGTIQFGATINNENVLTPYGSLTITEAGKYDVAFTYTVATNKITAEATLWVEQPETYAIVGELTGGWNDAGTEPDAAVMTLQDNGLYTYVVESFAAQAKTYQYKLRANNKWGVFELPASGNQEYTFNEAGNYKLTFTANVTGEAIDEVAAYTLTLNAEKIDEPQPELNTYTVTFDNGGNWEEVYAYAWTGGDASVVEYLGAWPGTKLEKDGDVYAVTIKAEVAPEKIIFNNGKDGDEAVQTDDLVFEDGKAYTYTVPTPEPFQYKAVYAVGNGDGTWLNDKAWDVSAAENKMTKVSDDVWEITFTGVTASEDRQFKFAIDGSWDRNFGGTFQEFGVETAAVWNSGENITFATAAETQDITLRLDLTGFDYETKEGAKFTIETTAAPQPEEPAEINKVQLLGDWNWDSATDNITLVKGDGNVWTGVLDLSDVTTNQEFKLVVNGGGDESDNWKGWIGTNNLTVDAPDNWVVATAETANANCMLNNATTGYQTYTITATWTPSPDYAAGWTLKIEGKDVRPEIVLNTYTATFTTNADWEKVYAYVWSGEGENKILGDWPGTELVKNADTGLYDVSFEAETAPEFIIFNNGIGGDGNQTEDLAFEDKKAYEYTVEQPEPTSNVLYSWESPAGVPVEKGGDAVASDGESVNWANADYYTIRLNGKTDFATSVTVTLDNALKAGDKINITGYRNKNDKNKKSGALVKFEKGSTTVSTATNGLEFVNIDQSDASADDSNRGTEPNTVTLIVPEDAAGSTTFTMTRAETQTNLFITKLEVTTDEQVEVQNHYNATFVNGGKWEEVYAYTWTGETKQLGDWPGTKLEKVSTKTIDEVEYDVYKVALTGTAAPENIIFSNGKAGDEAVQTEDLAFENGKAYEYIAPVEPKPEYTVSFVNTPEWEEVYAYAWSGSGETKVEQLGEWPGTKMQIPAAAKAEGGETTEADVYSITFNAETMPEFIIFNNGKEGDEAAQTENLVFVDEKEYTVDEPVEPDTWTVAGAPETVFGTLWNATDTNNDMVEQTDGTFKWEKTELTLPAGNLEFKVVKNHTWEVAYPANNYVLNIPESGIYTITITFNPEGNEVNAVATKTGNAEVEATYVVAGSLEAIFGTAWNGTDEANKMAKQDDGTYKKEYTDIVIPEGVTSFEYKIVKNGAEWIGDPANNGDNFVVSVNAGGTYNFTFTINPETNAVNCEAVRTDAPVEPDTWTIAGAQEILGSFWEPTDEANDMTSEDNTTWTLTKTGLFLAKGDYGYKVVKNHSWEVNYGTEPTEGNPDGNLYVTITEPGTYTVVFTFNSDTKALSAVATKTADYEVTSYNVVGSSVELFGEAWNPALNPMTKVSDGIYTWTKETVQLTAGDIEYKVAANGEWIVSYPEGGNNILGIPEDGLYNVVIKLDLTGAEPVVTAEAATATGIMRLQAEINNGDAVVYDLRGNRVRNVQRGIYIVNGRKQVVK